MVLSIVRLFGVASSSVLLLAMPVSVAPARAEDPPTLELSLKEHAFTPQELKVPAGKALSIKLRNLDATPAEFESHELKIEKVVSGNAEITVKVRPLKAGKYKFVDEYHEDAAVGYLVAE